MDLPIVSDINEIDNNMSFIINKVDVSIVNAIRRTILSDIPLLVFKTTPYEENKVNIIKNTSRFNNEIIKQRMGCIPVHINDLSIPFDKFKIILSVKNETSNVIQVTTEDFKIKDTATDTFISQEEVKKIFPPNKFTKDYIQLIRLRPKLSENLLGEEIQLSGELSISTAKENGMYNVVYICCFNNLPNQPLIQEKWKEKENELTSNGIKKEDLVELKTNWMILDAKRIIIEDGFYFQIKSLGIYKPTQLIKTAIDIINNKLSDISQGNGFTINKNQTTMKNSYDIIFDDEDYTIGKVLEFIMYNKYYINSSIVSYVSFYKAHPHNIEGILRVAFVNEVEIKSVSQFLISACEDVSGLFKEIKEKF